MSKRCMGCMKIINDDSNICPHCGYLQSSIETESVNMKPGTLFHDRYIIGKTIGSGAFGITYLAWDGKLEQRVAIKEYLPSDFSTRAAGQTTVTVYGGDKSEQFNAGRMKFIEEARKLSKFQNEEGIVKFFDSFEENGTAYIVMEYLEGMTLKEYLKQKGRIQEDDAVELLRPVMKSLVAVHGAGILHRDIAPDNIFITTRGELKLIDFGAARFATTTHSRSLTVVIKPGFSPEEQYRSTSDQGTYTDVYSLAATLYSMVTGVKPPDALVRRTKCEKDKKDILEAPHKYVKDISVGREIAILNAMNVQAEDRTQDIGTFIDELDADPPAKRKYGKIKKLDLYTWPKWLKVSIVAVLAALAVFGVLLLTGVIRFKSNYSDKVVVPDNMTVVPDIEGEQSNKAIKQIEDEKLIAVATGNVISQYVEAGKIVFQNPSAGSYLEINGKIEIIVSSGKGEVIEVEDGKATVPYVIWDTKDDAIEKLEISGLGMPNINETYDENVAKGLVISQSVEAYEKVDEGTVIDLVISLGPKPFKMPDVVGKTEAEAEKMLLDAGLGVIKEYKESNTVKEGNVSEQSVKAGNEVTRGDKITITVATKAATVTVENVVGKNRDEAKKILEKSGFVVSETEKNDNDAAKDTVISQTPAGETEQLPGTTITLIISKGPQNVNVKLDPKGGEVSNKTLTVVYGRKYGELPEAKRTGYFFAGWYTSAQGGTRVTENDIVSTASEHTLYAQWSNNSYTVTFDANGGTVDTVSKKVSYEYTYGELPVAKRPGYVFSGWYTASSGGSRVTSGTKVSNTSDHKLYARWQAQEYTVSFDANGGNSVNSIKVVYGMKYGTLPASNKTGYTFTGWYTSISGGEKVENNTKYSVTSNQTLFAHWNANKYTVSFDGNGGSNADSVIVNYDGQYGNLPVSTRTGYAFTGWYTSASGGDKIESSSRFSLTSDQTLYAHWNANPVTINFNGNGGSSPSSISVVYKSTYGTLPSSSRTGYVFDGWYTSANGGTKITSSSTVNITSTQTLYAHWSAQPYKVNFDANGGTTTTSSKTVYYNSTYGTLPTPVRDYYNFDGWYTSTSGGTKITNSSTFTRTSNQTLYAHWSEKGWGNWSGWSTNAVSAQSSGSLKIREVETKNVLYSYNMGYYLYTTVNGRQYRSYDNGYNQIRNPNCTVMAPDKSGWTAVAPGEWSPYIAGGYQGYNADSITGYYYSAGGENVIMFIMGENYQTQYRYRDRIK
ncbi:MAG: InlB B-repeat-containing protein [Lachnospiraceae bacterium]|nr:InlB B-repeat-containing protein [Lachnospiraceae bacterium]